MEITIDIDNPLPQFEQLIEQIKAAVTAGVLKPGTHCPRSASSPTISSSTARPWQRLTSC